jgi:hypothetical protein
VVTARGGSELLLEPIADQLMLDAVFSTKSDVFSLWPDKRGNSDEGAASEPLDDDTSADGSSSQQADGKIDVPDAFWLVIAPLLAAGIINRIPQMKMTRVSSLEPNEPAKAGV